MSLIYKTAEGKKVKVSRSHAAYQPLLQAAGAAKIAGWWIGLMVFSGVIGTVAAVATSQWLWLVWAMCFFISRTIIPMPIFVLAGAVLAYQDGWTKTVVILFIIPLIASHFARRNARFVKEKTDLINQAIAKEPLA